MITKLHLDKVASFKKPAFLETDKKINLIYGLNGTGKSTLSNYFYKLTEDRYKDCSIHGIDDNHEILVYNQSFIQDIFFESDTLKGIFTLSQANKDAETKIANAEKEIRKLELAAEAKHAELQHQHSLLMEKQENAKNAVWKIKTSYSGGDRVLEFCLDGYKASKDSLFNHIIGIQKPATKPSKSIDDLKNDLNSISGDNAQKYNELPSITFLTQTIETDAIFSKQIVGNENSTVSELIKKLGNSDWVKAGLNYLPAETNQSSACPFCQEETISSELTESLRSYFDASYEADIIRIKNHLATYSQSIQALPGKSLFEANPKFEPFKKDFEIKYTAFLKVLEDNKKSIEDKLKTPSVALTLQSSTKSLQELNGIVLKINDAIRHHNKNIDQKEKVRSDTKRGFWESMRWEYDQTINSFNTDKTSAKSSIVAVEAIIIDYNKKILDQRSIISEQQKKTVNILEAVNNINDSLADLGITDFKIKQHSENFYKIVRGENDERVFRSLSEGEKMIISFLYFIELCRGKKDSAEVAKKKIIVIDDPISSLSHIYVFNIGRLIRNEFFGKKESNNGVPSWTYKYEQFFLFTHSLYFFYEITDTKHEDRKETHKLFRLTKTDDGSAFVPMSYEEIQNDYHAYWSVIKDEKHPPALIANCMRNIIEYFFNFVEKKDLSGFFNQAPLNSNRFQAFYRYINRESHSLGQNIFDLKEFNYTDFKDAFKELFNVTGYDKHYKKMMR